MEKGEKQKEEFSFHSSTLAQIHWKLNQQMSSVPNDWLIKCIDLHKMCFLRLYSSESFCIEYDAFNSFLKSSAKYQWSGFHFGFREVF